MGRVCLGRVCYGPSLSWAEFVMGRVVQIPFYRYGLDFVIPVGYQQHMKCQNGVSIIPKFMVELKCRIIKYFIRCGAVVLFAEVFICGPFICIYKATFTFCFCIPMNSFSLICDIVNFGINIFN